MSLEFQREDCLRYAQNKDLTVVRVFEEEGESAKFTDRPALIEMLEFCRKNKGKLDAMIVWKLDRLSRNRLDYYYLKRVLLDSGVPIKSATEPALDDSSIAGKVYETFSALQAEIDNTMRHERAVRGMKAKIASGIFPWKPPPGYKAGRDHVKGQKKTKADAPDEERFLLIQRLFRTCLDKHICGTVELAKLANEWGLRTGTEKKVYPQLIDRIMVNKFYAGLVVNPWDGEEVEGKHERMISPEEFYKIQWLRNGKKPPEFQRRRIEHPDFPLRKIVKCALCCSPLTGSWSRGNGGKYAYYHCANKKCDMFGKGIKKSELEDAFLLKLATVTPRESVLALLKEVVIRLWEQQRGILEDVVRKNQRTLRELQESLEGLINMKMKNLLSDEEFLTRKVKLRNEMAAAQVILSESKTDQLDIEKVLNCTMNFIATLPQQWFHLSPEIKWRFQKELFPEGIPYNRGIGFGTAKLGLIYELCGQSCGQKSLLVRLVGNRWNQAVEALREIAEIARIKLELELEAAA